MQTGPKKVHIISNLLQRQAYGKLNSTKLSLPLGFKKEKLEEQLRAYLYYLQKKRLCQNFTLISSPVHFLLFGLPDGGENICSLATQKRRGCSWYKVAFLHTCRNVNYL